MKKILIILGIGFFVLAGICFAETKPVEIPIEAESFHLGKGWEITDKGYFTAQPNLWSGKKIVADETDKPASCYKIIDIPESGEYNLWVHYESCYGFGSLFGIKVIQNKRVVFDKKFGSMYDKKYFPFGRGFRVQGPWFWHNTDLVYQGGRLNLKKGKAKIIIYKDKNEIPAAKRYIDFVFLTTDLSLKPGDDSNWRKPNILSHFHQPLYLKVNIPEERKESLYLRLHTNFWLIGYYRGPRKDYYITSKGLTKIIRGKTPKPAAENCLIPGASTPVIGIALHTAMPSELHFTAFNSKGEKTSMKGIEIEISKEKGKLLRKIICNKDEEFILIPWGVGQYEKGLLGGENILTFDEMLKKQLKVVKNFHPKGKKPKKFFVFSSLSPISPLYLDLISEIGINGQMGVSEEIYGKNAKDRGFIKDRGHTTVQNWHLNRPCYEGNFKKLEERYKRVADNLKKNGLWNIPLNIKLIEESGGMNLNSMRSSPIINQKFRDYLKEKGIKPEEVIPPEELRKIVSSGNVPSEEELWKMVKIGKGTPEEAIKNPKLYYYSHRFRTYIFAEVNKKATELIEKYFAPGTRTNSGSIYPSVGEGPTLARGVDPFVLFKNRGVTSYFSEISWVGGTPASLGAETGSYEGSLARAFSKYYNIPMETYLICDANRGYTPIWVKLYAYSLISQGITGLDFFALCITECNAIGYPEMLKAIKEISYTVGDVEEYLIGAKVKPAKVALGWSSTTDIWDASIPEEAFPPFTAGNNIYPMERHCLYYALRHNQIPVDILSEEDLIDGYLKNYKVYYLVGDHLRKEAAEAIKDWVKEGGILVSVAGGGFYDNFNQPLDTLKEVYGIKTERLNKITNWMRPKLELLHAQPIDTITFSKPGLKGLKLDAYAYKQTFTPSTAEVWGRYEDGKPAVLCNNYGKGKAIIIGTLPGFAYVKPAIPLLPYGRSSNTEEELSFFIPTDYSKSVRKIVGFPISLAKIDKEVETSEPLVETTIMECKDKNTLLIPLVNHSLKDISALKIKLNIKGIKSIKSQKQGEIKYEQTKDGVTFPLSLKLVDFLILKR